MRETRDLASLSEVCTLRKGPKHVERRDNGEDEDCERHPEHPERVSRLGGDVIVQFGRLIAHFFPGFASNDFLMASCHVMPVILRVSGFRPGFAFAGFFCCDIGAFYHARL